MTISAFPAEFSAAWASHDFHALTVEAGVFPSLLGDVTQPTRFFLSTDAIAHGDQGQVPSERVHDGSVRPVASMDGEKLIVHDLSELPRLCDLLRGLGYEPKIWSGRVAGGNETSVTV